MKKLMTILLSFFLCLGVYNQVYAIDNYVLNGDFSQGIDYWKINKKEATDGVLQVKNNELLFSPTKGNNNYWELGFKQSNIKLSNGQKYRLSFEGKANEEVSIKVTFENQDNYTKRLDDTDLTLKTDYQKYEFDFIQNDDGLSQLVYHIGEDKNLGKEYFFRNISIKEVPVQKKGQWILNEANGVSGTLSGTEDNIQVKINQINENWWDLTLKKDNIELEPKKIYKVSFDVNSDKEGTISFDIENTNNYEMKALDRTLLNLKEGKNSFEFTFVKRNDAKESIAFHLSQGDGNSDLTSANIGIDNIQFVEIEDMSSEYVFNGLFDNGVAGWEVYNSNGSDLSIDSQNEEGVLTFASCQGNNWWDAQFFQKDIILNNGVYKVSFDIKADKESSIHFSVQDTNDYNVKYLDDRILELSTEFKKLNFEFSIKSNNLLGTTKNTKLQFDVGKNSDVIIENIFIDNVKIEKVGNVNIDNLETGEIHFDVNDVITKDFKGLGVQWDPYQVHPLTDEEWTMVCKRVDYLNPSFIRCMIYATTYCKGLDNNKKPIYDFESDDMKALIKELDYLESRHIEVILGEWEAPDRFKGKFSGVTVDSPLWAEMISGLMDYLINEKGYTCIKYFNYVNEANTDWSYCEDYGKWSKGINYLHDAFEKINILDKVQITGPDTVWDDGHTWLNNLESDSSMNQKIGLYDVHMYPSIDEITNGEIEKTVKKQRNTVTGKDFYMTEIGMVTGKTDGDSQPYVKEFSYGVIMADAVSQVMRGGLSGVAIWDLDDAMHDQKNGFPSTDIRSLKQWGFWNSIANRVYNQPEEEKIRPHFYTWSLMTHLFPRHSSVVNASWSKDLNGLRAVGVKTNNNQMTYMIVNDSNIAKTVNVYDNSTTTSRTILEYRYFEDDREVNDLGYPIIKNIHKDINFSEGMEIDIPSGGVVFLTTIDTDTMAQQGQIQIKHIDTVSKDSIEGARFELIDKDGRVIDEWESQINNHMIKGLTPSESYTIKQIFAPKGYLKMSDVSIKVEDYMNDKIIVTANERVKGQVVLNVVDKNTQEPLTNVEYVLKDIYGNILEILKTDKNGQAKSQHYDIATYTNGQYNKAIQYILVENKTIHSYEKDLQKYIIEFEYADDKTNIINKKINIQKLKSATIQIEKPSNDKTDYLDNNINHKKTLINTYDSTDFIIILLLAFMSIIGLVMVTIRRKQE